MNGEQAQLYLIKGVIASMPEEDQKQLFECADKVNEALDLFPKEIALMTLAWVTTERSIGL